MAEPAIPDDMPRATSAPAGLVHATSPARSRLPRGVRMVVGGVVVGAVGSLAGLTQTGAIRAGIGRPATVALFTVLVLVSWLRPLIMQRGSQSEAVHPDEAAFVVAAILLPPLGVLALFSVAVVASHLVRRPAWVKVVFNCGQLITAVGTAVLAVELVGGGAPVASARRIAAALIGAAVFFAVNSLWMGLLMQAMGFKTLRAAFLDGVGIHVRIATGGAVLAVFVGVAAAAQTWILICGFLPFLILRQVLTGHFQARHDRTRLEGLLRATIEANRTMGADAAVRAIEEAAVDLLRCERATVTAARPAPGALAAPLHREGTPLWLVVEGRKKAEPLESADLAMLDTLAAVATGALTNASLYEQLTHRAFNDMLTGLPNRRLFLDQLDQAMARSSRRGETNAVLFIDVDRFKTVNDNLGHHAGDALLVGLARRLQAVVRTGETLARFGGDEFTLLLEGVCGVAAAMTVAERIRDELREPIRVTDTHEIFATVSIGIAVTTGHTTRDDVLHDADVAMYQAKAKGPGHVEIFDAAAMQARSAERLDLESALRRALDRDELEVHFQPIFAAAGSPIIGTEALVRWNHPRRGVISPAEFVPLAEETGLILTMGRYVLERACQQARVWHDELDAGLTTSINLSARQFQQPGLSEEIGYIIDGAGVDPSLVCLEITESVAMTDADRTIAILHELKSLGVLLAIDDFGTGYSSLGYLKRFPVDIVKVDRSFVAGIGVNAVDEAIVAAVVNLAHAVGMTTVAEGVETAEQLEHLRGLGCKGVQGFYFARPAPAAAVSAMLKEQQAGVRRSGLRVVRHAG